MTHRPVPDTCRVAVATRPRPAHAVRIVRRVAPLLPLAALLALLVVSALTGRGAPAPAVASTTIDVSGTVSPLISLDASGCAGGAIDLGTLVPGDPFATTASDCVMDFGTTNHLPGVSLVVNEDPTAPAAGHAMKCQSASCGADALDDYDAAGAPAAGTSAFGMLLQSASGAASSVWTADPAIHDVPDVAEATCQTAGVGTGTCAFRFGGSADIATDRPGTYQALVEFTVVPR